ncbi:MAG: hypothetical protein ACE5H2_02575 [Terriglobia bacterium]
MTSLQVCYRYAGKLTLAQRRKLGELCGVYGLRRITLEEECNQLQIEFDASRLKESEAVHILHRAGIPLTQKIEAH